MSGLAHDIPPHWAVTRMSRVARIEEGLVDPTAPEFEDALLVAPNHIEKHTGRLMYRETVKEQGADSGKGVARAGQVIYSKIRPALNKVAIAPTDCLISADMYALDGFGTTSSRFLWYWLRAQPFLDYASLTSMRVKMPKVNRDEVAAGPALLVPMPEQMRIVDFLDRETAQIDTLISEQERLIDLLRERRRTAVKEAFTDVAAPADRLGRYTRIGNGSTPRRENVEYWEGGTTPWLNSAAVNQAMVTSSDQFVTERALAECHLPVVPSGSVLVGLTGQGKTRGMSTLLGIEATVSQHVAYVAPDLSRWLPEYVNWALTASYEQLRERSDENGSTKGGLTCDALSRHRLAMPPLDIQRDVSTRLSKLTAATDQLITEAERLIELAKERRSALITAAVTGQIEIPEAS